jgi:hypothetical protein
MGIDLEELSDRVSLDRGFQWATAWMYTGAGIALGGLVCYLLSAWAVVGIGGTIATVAFIYSWIVMGRHFDEFDMTPHL